MSARTGAVISEQTFGETVADAFGVPFALAADGKWHRADASDPLLSLGDVALCIETSVAADGTGSLLKYGYIQRTGWTWTLGQPVYFGATPGTLTQTKPAGNTIRYAGYPAAADALWFSPTDPVLAEYLSLDLPTGTQGDLLYHNGTAWAVLNPDTAGQILQTGGPGANPAWADLPDGLYRNAIINGNFDIWQRGTSFSGSKIEYTADRWLNLHPIHSVSRQEFALGQTEVPGNPRYYLRLTATVDNQWGFRLVQRIEDVSVFGGRTVTVSFWARSNVSRTANVHLIQNFGSGGSPQVDHVKSGIHIGTSWSLVTVTFSLGSVSGKTIGTGNYLQFETLSQQVIGDTLDIAQVQLNIGDKPLPFAPRPYAEELALCQRYFRRESTIGTNGAAQFGAGGRAMSTTRAHITWPISSPMRVLPTLSTSGSFILHRSGGSIPVTAIYLYPATPSNLSLAVDVASGLIAGESNILSIATATEGHIDFDAEL